MLTTKQDEREKREAELSQRRAVGFGRLMCAALLKGVAARKDRERLLRKKAKEEKTKCVA